jgi:ParB family chromosome partitioning protein
MHWKLQFSYQRLMDECSITHEQLSDRVGKNRSTVTNYVRLLKLPAQIQASVKNGELSMGHARALAGIDNLALQLKVYRETIEKGLSVRALEQLIKYHQLPNPKSDAHKTKQINPEIIKIRDEFRRAFGGGVDIKRDSTGKGTILLPFNSDDEFNNLVDILRHEKV